MIARVLDPAFLCIRHNQYLSKLYHFVQELEELVLDLD